VSGRRGEWGGEAPGGGLLPAIAAIAESGLGVAWVEWVLHGFE